ncbi:MAG TPA: PLP-dependent transferase [Trueperaceae bacterium]|nr:PLP-dependent transferase [Trueperaceae bacterium]
MAASKPRPETVAIHAGSEPDATTGAVVPPIHLSTTFERDADGSYPRGFVYTRSDNPNRRALEAVLAALQGGAAAAAFASGSAAASAVLRALPRGAHVLLPREIYHGIRKLVDGALAGPELRVDYVDMTDIAALEAAWREETALVWVETPSNPLLSITDLSPVCGLAHARGARVAVDATWTPPGVADPIALGADVVVHATTKYLSGHSDVLGGAVVTARADEVWERIIFLQRNEGAVPGPFDCWLAHRGLRTLPYRMRGHAANAEAVASFLAGHEAVARVHYPGLASHPGHAVAKRQMTSYGGMLSFRLRGGEAAAMAAAARTRLFTRATSLGGVESLIEHRASIEGPGSGTPADLLRLSVGLEHPDDLVADLAQALAG